MNTTMSLFFSALTVTFLIAIAAGSKSEEELCATVTKIDCNTQYSSDPNENVCGSNGVTYPNRCFFAQAKCHNENLDIICKGECSTCSGTKSTTEISLTSDNTAKPIGLSGRRLAENSSNTTSGPSVDVLTSGNPTTLSSIDERLRNLSEVNITRTRKHLPGHHVAQRTETTTKDIPFINERSFSNNTETAPGNATDCRTGNCSSINSTSSVLKISNITSSLLSILTGSTIDSIQTSISDNMNSTTTHNSLTAISVKLVIPLTTPALPIISRTTTNAKSLTLKALTSFKSTILSTKNQSEHSNISTRQTLLTLLTTKVPGNNPSEQSSEEKEFVLFCTNVDSKVCPKTLDPLCGTDNKFYLNLCTFNKAKCKDRSLGLQNELSICRERRT